MSRLPALLRRLVLGLTLGLAAAIPAAAEDVTALKHALASVGAKDWGAAATAARQSGPLAQALVDWHRLRAGQGSFAEAVDFIARHGDWPGLALLRERAEGRITDSTRSEAILAWFGEDDPLTGVGARRLVAAIAARDRAVAGARAAAIWAAGRVPLSAGDEAIWLRDWPEALKPLHMGRAEALLDSGQWQAALRLLPLLSHADAALVELRADLQSGGPRLEARLAALDKTTAADAGLNLDSFRWRVREKDAAGAQELMLARSGSAEALRDPAAWAGKRADYARAALRAGDAALARRLAEGHHLQVRTAAWLDLEWLAGYAALLSGDPAAAHKHFAALEAESASAITQSRALYWQARAVAAQGDKDAASALMARAAVHQTTFYGQLAAEAAGIPMDAGLIAPLAAVPDWRGAAIRRDLRVQAAIWLLVAGDADLAQRFLLHVAETVSGEDTARFARLMAEFGHTHHALRLAKVAAQNGAVHPAVLFPVPDIADAALGIPAELTLAIARRESEFNPTARSHAGARGLMQVMPDTARHIARDVGLPFDLARLGAEAGYNALYGATYLAQLRARFGPSIALVAAGYNAGPGRSSQWLGALGDLRAGADPVDWVEAIPFDETRNYVMRVAEALPIYRARLQGAPVPLTPTRDLTGGGVASIAIPRPVLAPPASARPLLKPGTAAPAVPVAAAPTPAPSALPAPAVALTATAAADAPARVLAPSIPPPPPTE